MPSILRLSCACTVVVMLAVLADRPGTNRRLKRVTAGSLRLSVPDSWERVRNVSKPRLAQYKILSPDREGESADFVVFESRASVGGVQENIQRWIDQFQPKDRTSKLFYGNWLAGDYVLADIAGSWQEKSSETAGTSSGPVVPRRRLLGAVLMRRTGIAADYEFIVLSGPDALVNSQAAAFRATIGAKPESERPFKMTDDLVVRSEAEWKRLLTPEQYRVLRGKGTERPFQNEYDKLFREGTYSCAACGQDLFSSSTKFNSGCGWPAFYAAEAGDRVKLTADFSLGMARTEVTCARCGSHLGHIFDDAPQTPTGQRYCINSVSLKFTPKKGDADPQRKPRKKGE